MHHPVTTFHANYEFPYSVLSFPLLFLSFLLIYICKFIRENVTSIRWSIILTFDLLQTSVTVYHPSSSSVIHQSETHYPSVHRKVSGLISLRDVATFLSLDLHLYPLKWVTYRTPRFGFFFSFDFRIEVVPTFFFVFFPLSKLP